MRFPEAQASTESSCLLPGGGRSTDGIMSDGGGDDVDNEDAESGAQASGSKINVSARGIRYPPAETIARASSDVASQLDLTDRRRTARRQV